MARNAAAPLPRIRRKVYYSLKCYVNVRTLAHILVSFFWEITVYLVFMSRLGSQVPGGQAYEQEPIILTLEMQILSRAVQYSHNNFSSEQTRDAAESTHRRQVRPRQGLMKGLGGPHWHV